MYTYTYMHIVLLYLMHGIFKHKVIIIIGSNFLHILWVWPGYSAVLDGALTITSSFSNKRL